MRILFLLACLLYISLNAAVVCANEKILILGYQNELANHKVWQDNQVGFGVKNQLRQILFEQQNSYILDEKTLSLQDVSPQEALLQEKSSRDASVITLHDDSKPAWMLEKNDVSVQYLSSLAKKYQLDSIYWVKVTRFIKPKSELTIAIWSSKKVTKELTLQVCRFIYSDFVIDCQEGKGRSTKKSRSFFYKPIKDRHKRQKHFNDSAVGKISLQAIEQAIGKL